MFAEIFGSRWGNKKGSARVSPFHLISILAQILSIADILGFGEQSALLSEDDVIKQWKSREEGLRWTSVPPWSSESSESPAEC